MLENAIFQQIFEKVRCVRMGFLKLHQKIELNNITTTKLSDVYFIHLFLSKSYVRIGRQRKYTSISRHCALFKKDWFRHVTHDTINVEIN